MTLPYPTPPDQGLGALGPPLCPALHCACGSVGMCCCRCCPAGSSHEILSVKASPRPEPGGMCHPQPFCSLLAFWWHFWGFAGIFSVLSAVVLWHSGNALPLPDTAIHSPGASQGLCLTFSLSEVGVSTHGRAEQGLHPPGSVQKRKERK